MKPDTFWRRAALLSGQLEVVLTRLFAVAELLLELGDTRHEQQDLELAA